MRGRRNKREWRPVQVQTNYRIEEAMEHINFAKAEISLWMIIDEVPDGRIKKCTQLSMITIEARHLLLQKK